MNRPPAECRALVHGTWWACQRHGCQCPEAAADVRERWRRKSAARRARQAKPRPEAVSTVRLAAVDPISVQLACDGYPDRLTVPERAQAVAVLSRRRLARHEIAQRLGCSTRTVDRHRARVRTPHG